MQRLLELPAEKLLEKIGAGEHKPGSGSAAALNAILSSKLLLTVLQLTLEPKRESTYKPIHSECNQIMGEIGSEIVPRLEELFQEDSDQFDKTIRKRQERDLEKNQSRKNKLEEEAVAELKVSTEKPLEIAALSIRLANHAIFAFDNCFRSARGDSGVALGSALASISGCISIVSLNLRSIPKDSWTKKINRKKAKIRIEHDNIASANFERLDKLNNEAISKSEFLAEILSVRRSLFGKKGISYEDIELLTRRIQNTLWKYKDLIWTKKSPSVELDILKPEKVIKLLKYAFQRVPSLGVTGFNEEVAGLIDNENSVIRISQAFPSEVMNFTCAHELGHALMHNEMVLHRDRPLDGSDLSITRSIEELQADKFAVYFLMPEKPLRNVFVQLFRVRRLEISNEVSFAFNKASPGAFRDEVESLRGFSRYVAGSEFFNYESFTPIYKIFNVSIEAMAIRLEELDLVTFD